MSEIEVKHLSKTFEQKGVHVDALKDINLTIGAGDIYGIIGMSGAGKSTLVRCLNFLERPTDGQVLIEGKDLGTLNEKELRKQRSDIAMIFQHFNLLMQKNVIDNICFPLQIQGVKKKEARAKARELLKTVGLEEKEKAYPAQLSGGQKQRVAIARALASNPKILLCDEATSALDPQTTASILELLKSINDRYPVTDFTDHGHLVCDDHDRDLKLLIDAFQKFQDRSSRLWVKCTGRLVTEKYFRVGCKCSCDGNTLLLSTGELCRISLLFFLKSDCL